MSKIKTAEELYNETLLRNNLEYKEDIIALIKFAQQNVIEETLKIAADNANGNFEPMGWLAEQHMNTKFIKGEDYKVPILKNSILDLKEGLLKQLFINNISTNGIE